MRLAAPMPPKKDRGTEMTRAQGQLTTRKMSADCTLAVRVSPKNRGLATAIAAARPTTIGV